MTPLHLAARQIEPRLVQLLLEKRANANALTSRAKKPGGYCALACIADIGAQDSRWDDISRTAKLFVGHMEMDTFAARTSTGRTLWHLLASQGNARLLKLLLDHFDSKYGRPEIEKQLHILTSNDGTGKSVKDDAMPSNKLCRDLVANKGGKNVHPKVRNPCEFLLPGHPLHRHKARQ